MAMSYEYCDLKQARAERQYRHQQSAHPTCHGPTKGTTHAGKESWKHECILQRLSWPLLILEKILNILRAGERV